MSRKASEMRVGQGVDRAADLVVELDRELALALLFQAHQAAG
jgi:hypothetical protein